MSDGLQHISKSLPAQGSSETAKTQPSDNPEELPAEDECPICHGAGYLHPLGANGQVDYSRTVSCECKHEEIEKQRRERLLKYCDLPYATADLTFENFRVDKRWPSLKEAKDAAIELADESGNTKWLVLSGEVECGKSHLAIAICRRWLERSKPARYVLVPIMLDELRQGYDQNGAESYDARLNLLYRVDLLVLDDLGAQTPTAWAMEKLMMIIDYRYINGLPLVVTTNKKLNDLPGDDEHRIGSRLMRFPASKRVTIEAPEYRTWRK